MARRNPWLRSLLTLPMELRLSNQEVSTDNPENKEITDTQESNTMKVETTINKIEKSMATEVDTEVAAVAIEVQTEAEEEVALLMNTELRLQQLKAMKA